MGKTYEGKKNKVKKKKNKWPGGQEKGISCWRMIRLLTSQAASVLQASKSSLLS